MGSVPQAEGPGQPWGVLWGCAQAGAGQPEGRLGRGSPGQAGRGQHGPHGRGTEEGLGWPGTALRFPEAASGDYCRLFPQAVGPGGVAGPVQIVNNKFLAWSGVMEWQEVSPAVARVAAGPAHPR